MQTIEDRIARDSSTVARNDSVNYGAIVATQSAGFIAGGMLSLRWRPARPLLVSTLALLPTAAEIACYASVRVTAVPFLAVSGET